MTHSHRFAFSMVAAMSLAAAVPAFAAPGDMGAMGSGMMGQMMHGRNMQGGRAGGPHGPMAFAQTGAAGTHPQATARGAMAGGCAMTSMMSQHGTQAGRK